MLINKTFRRLCLPAVTGLAAILAGCGGGGSDAGQGTLAVSMTDAPACGYKNVYVTVTKVRAHKSSDATDSDGGWQDIAVATPEKIDLLTLTNGALPKLLGSTPLPAGHYTQVRLVLQQNGNSVISENSTTEVPLATPSGTQSGLKVNIKDGGIDVAANSQTNLMLDFDACKSVVKTGNGSLLLKPVITGFLTAASGATTGIAGYVTPGLTKPVVTAQQDGVVIKATVPDPAGKFDLSPLPASSTNYVVVLTADGATTAAITGVPITSGGVTSVSTSTAPIAPTTLAINRIISGAATPAAAQALVRATQTSSNGTKMEVGFSSADLTSGAYSLSVPAAAPLLGSYSSTLPITLSADAAVAGKYSVEALTTVSGYTSKTTSVDVSSADVAANFTMAP